VEGVGEQRTNAIPIPTSMPLESKRRHIYDPVLLSLKMEGIRLLFVGVLRFVPVSYNSTNIPYLYTFIHHGSSAVPVLGSSLSTPPTK
jgi:hypothetical protein